MDPRRLFSSLLPLTSFPSSTSPSSPRPSKSSIPSRWSVEGRPACPCVREKGGGGLTYWRVGRFEVNEALSIFE